MIHLLLLLLLAVLLAIGDRLLESRDQEHARWLRRFRRRNLTIFHLPRGPWPGI